MRLLALIPLLLLQPITVVTTTTDNDGIENMKPGGVCGDDMGPNDISLFNRGDDAGPNLQCDLGDDCSKPVTCSDFPLDNPHSKQVGGWESFAICSGNDRGPCNTSVRRTISGDIKCLDGCELERTNSGAAAEGSTGDAGGDDCGGNEALMETNKAENKPKKRARRANMYSFVIRETVYHIEINSSLGQTYRNLATKAEQREFMIEHGKAKPYNGSGRLWAAR